MGAQHPAQNKPFDCMIFEYGLKTKTFKLDQRHHLRGFRQSGFIKPTSHKNSLNRDSNSFGNFLENY